MNVVTSRALRVTVAIVSLSMLMFTAVLALAQTETILYNFCSQPNCADGGGPYGRIIADAKGNFYGTTVGGGAYGYGVVFVLRPTGTETVLHSFANNGTDGYTSYAGLVRGKKGNLYGTTSSGGAYGGGTIFKVSAKGAETILHNFANDGRDGYYPIAALIIDKVGNLYGTTRLGGTYGYGTVFKVGTDGTETILHSFADDGIDGILPSAELIMDKTGNLYGTTDQGGTNHVGTVFEINSIGTEIVLYSFANNGSDGLIPQAGLVRNAKGNLYGTTAGGGDYRCGTVFEVSAKGAETILYSFINNDIDGVFPYAGLVRDAKGNLYGTTYTGGAYQGYGTVFKVAPNGTETILHSFNHDGTDGGSPQAGLLRDKKGNLYGTTTDGGSGGGGIVFEITP